MTNKEAMEILTSIKNTPTIKWENGADIAFDLAIKALEERPQGDLISREALKKAMNEKALNLSDGGRIFIENINKIIDNAPTVERVINMYPKGDVIVQEKRPQGEWIKDEEHSITINMFRCSNCNGGGYPHFKYCPHCGSEMVVRNDDT